MLIEITTLSIITIETTHKLLISHSRYEKRIVELLSVAPKLFHRYIRSRKKGCPSVGPLRTVDGELVSDAESMSNIFVQAFSSVFVADPPVNPHVHQTHNGTMNCGI